MTNNHCKIGKKIQAARRIAGMLVSGALAGSIAAGGVGAVSVTAASWVENADYIFEYLTQELGYTEAAACGIMANIRCESTFNPHAWNAGGGSYGLCQWTGGRYGRLRNWCRSNGFDYTTIDGQLAYLEYELENFYPGVESHLRSVENTSDGAYDAGQYYCYHFEAPASRGSVSVYRGGLASGTFWDSYRPAEWYQVDGVWHYILRDGSYQTDWLTIEDDTFYFDRDGNRISGWRTIEGDRYFFDEDGAMVKGWKKIDGRSFYFDSDGSLVTGILHSGEDWYLLDEHGDVQASAAMEDFAPAWTAAAAEREEETALASAETGEASDQTAALPEKDTSGQAALSGSLTTTPGGQSKAPVSPARAIGLAEGGDQKAVPSSVDLLREAAVQASGAAQAASSAQTASSGQDDSSEQDMAKALAKNDSYEEEDYQASAEAMQAAATALAGDEADEESERAELPFYIPSSAVDLAGPLPDLSNETAGPEDLPVFSADSEEEPEKSEKETTEEEMPADTSRDDHQADLAADEETAEEASTGLTAEESGMAGTRKDEDPQEDSDSDGPSDTAEEAETAASTAAETEKDLQSEEQKDSDGEETPESADVSDTVDDPDTGKAEKDSEDTQEKENDPGADSAEEDLVTEKDVPEAENKDEKDQFLLENPGIKDGDDKISLSEMEVKRREDSEAEPAVSAEKERVVISADQEHFPVFDKEELEDPETLLETLREKQLLKATAGNGLDITPEVTAEIERSEEDENIYVITFRAEFNGSSTETRVVIETSGMNQ